MQTRMLMLPLVAGVAIAGLLAACADEPAKAQAAVYGDTSKVRLVEARTGFDMPAYSEVVNETIRDDRHAFTFVCPMSVLHTQAHCDQQAGTMGFAKETDWQRHTSPKAGWQATWRGPSGSIVVWATPVGNGTLVEVEQVRQP